ncbi:tectonic-like complex member Mks1 [Toxorhynchites rutilus septentrionalis]|uniref:tectonic-like complex member Mks1 n=1 Tax=Toxorhynchites rutilus septentrionalis TaxID=329112 RepID=UPI0024799CCB|nr:tectonic-like complex member Mks1 [Toxorhynchites rutilus septentrionalis]
METMFVMADLDTEELLFSLAWNSTENVLFVYPDFNCMKINPYYKEIQGDSRQMYHFGIKNLSFKKWITCSQETVEIRDVFASKITRFNIRDKLSKDNFEYPENHQVQFLILLEIISGTGFSYSDIFIRYRLDIPSAAKMIAGFVDGSTHSTKQCKGRWLYGHCHEITLQLPENHKTSDDCVRIYFDIISTDSWKRERLLGNAYLQISTSFLNTSFERDLICSKVLNNGTIFDKLEAFLVGGRREVKTLNFYGQNDSLLLNRYGSRTEQAGHLKIKCQVIQQHRPQAIHISASTKKRNKLSSNLITIEELLSSYHQARERLEEIVKLDYC